MPNITGASAHESVAVAGTAVGITATVQDGTLPHSAYITVEGADVRYCFDGTTATATVGHLATNGDVLFLTERDQIARFSVISVSGAAATLKVTVGQGFQP